MYRLDVDPIWQCVGFTSKKCQIKNTVTYNISIQNISEPFIFLLKYPIKYQRLLYNSQDQDGNRGSDDRYKSPIKELYQNITSNNDVQYPKIF